MKSRQRLGIGVSAFVLAAIMSAPAMAQSTPNTEQEAGGIGDIVVTARKREERAQDTPISVSVQTGQDLEEQAVDSFIDLQRTTPALRLTPSVLSGTTAFMAMRGQGVTDTRLNVDPAIGVYVDGVYMPRSTGLDVAELMDIDRVEVLRGPQGTLYGRSTTAGAVNMYTALPTQEFEGQLRVRGAEYSELGYGGVLNVPLGDQFALRLVASHRERDGYGHDLISGDELGEVDADSIRISALLEATPELRIILRADWASANTTPIANKGSGVMNPGSLANNRVATETGLSVAAARLLYLTYHEGDPYDASFSQRSHDDVDVYGASATVEADFSPELSLRSISAYRGFERSSAIDLDGSPFQILDFNVMETTDNQWSQELQLLGSNFDDRFNWILGLFYSEESGTEYLQQTSIGAISFQDAKVDNESTGVFGQGTFSFTDQLSLTAGVRYSVDDRSVTSANRNLTTCLALGQLLTAGPCHRVTSDTFDAVSYTLGLEYRPTSDLLFYAKTNRGYRSGLIPLTGGATTPAAATTYWTPVNPEIVTDYEVGMKADWFDRRFRSNIALYYTNYDDIQRNASALIPGTTSTISITRNAATAIIQGVEADFTALITPNLELTAGVVFTDAEFDRYVSGGVDLSSRPIIFAPDLTYSVSANYTVPLPFGSAGFRVDYMWEDVTATSEPAAFRDEYEILSARATLEFDAAGFSVAIYGTNLTEEDNVMFLTDTRGSIGILSEHGSLPPRTVGIQLVKDF